MNRKTFWLLVSLIANILILISYILIPLLVYAEEWKIAFVLAFFSISVHLQEVKNEKVT